MYAAYFGLKENPFNLTPDQRYLFLSRHHRDALAHLLYGIKEKKGFVAITGGIGTGKTIICRAVLDRLKSSTKCALIFNTSISDTELLETINKEFGADTGGTRRTRKDLIDRLNEFLLDNFKRGGNAVLVIDEAQNLSPAVLEQIRMLSNLETDREKLIQIVLVGQSELGKLLAGRNLRQLNERITVRYELQPLNRRDVQNYVEHRLVVAGSRGSVRFSKGACRALYSYSRGIPRRINAVCDRALLVAYCNDEFTISRNTILQAVRDIRGDSGLLHGKAQWVRTRPVLAAAAMLVGFVVATLSGWNFMEQIPGLLSPVEKVAVVQSKTFLPRRVELEKTAVLHKPFVRKPVETAKESASLVLDQRASLRGLFKLFDVQEAQRSFAAGEVYPNLFVFEGDPELCWMLQRPFRLRIKSDNSDRAGYLLIHQVTASGAIAFDAEGNKWPVSEDYILANWAGEISWVYPYEQMYGKLTQGMSGLSVLKFQQMLQHIGYLVEPRGFYDRTTFDEVMRFQRDLGLEPDGIADTRTRAFLYQVSG